MLGAWYALVLIGLLFPRWVLADMAAHCKRHQLMHGIVGTFVWVSMLLGGW